MTRPSRARRILIGTGIALSLVTFSTWMWTSSLGEDRVLTFGPPCCIVSDRYLVFASQRSVADDFSVSFGSQARLESKLAIAWPTIRFPHAAGPPGQHHFTVVAIPFWFMFAMAAVPTAWLWHRDRRRIRPGCCLRCGYDLTGNTSGVCSECGEPKPPPATV